MSCNLLHHPSARHHQIHKDIAAAMITSQISADRLQATIDITLTPGDEELLTVEYVMQVLAEQQVVAGINEEAIKMFCQQATANPGQSVKGIVAQGIKFVESSQPIYKFYFATRKSIGQVLESGKIDYRDRGAVNFYQPGAVLLKITPGKAGCKGLQVDGTVTEPEPLKHLKKITAGKNVAMETDADGCLIFKSQAAGQANLDGSQVIIENIYHLEGDVNLDTGHIKYQGPVQVSGNLDAGFSIISNNDVFIGKLIDGGSVKAKGDLVVGTGIIGNPEASLTVMGNIKSEYISGVVHCKTKGSIIAEKHIINSSLIAGGAIRCAGKITGECVISAFSGVETGELGSESASRALVEVGNTVFIREQLQKIEQVMTPMVERSIEIVDSIGMPVIIKKDPSLLPPDKREEGTQLLKEYQQIDKQMNLLKKKKVDLEEKIAAASAARVTVHHQVHPGVVIKIGHETYTVDKPLSGPVSFWLDHDNKRITTR
ncbi:MAG: DUF342 domain-containing protein [Deltaproteobacteria bacterium]|nr:DUF342 domain-containing protein [Candidatus Anaeroferrophillus wilburensis]MBN2889665.1 DUF342 domain-containing protein [Deltaproteobacteria bacterium]